jgi:hypothetical protein
MTGWHFDARDTPQQRSILRRSRQAQKVRAMFPPETRVTTGRMTGVVKRHVPCGNSQGGHLVVTWENDVTGRISPIAVEPVA